MGDTYPSALYARARSVGRLLVNSTPRHITAELALDLDDYTQELAIRGWLALAKLRDPTKLQGFHRRACWNRGQDLLRRARRRVGVVYRDDRQCTNAFDWGGIDRKVCERLLARVQERDRSILWCLILERGCVTDAYRRWLRLSVENTGSRPTFSRRVTAIREELRGTL